MRLFDLFQTSERKAETHTWDLNIHDPDDERQLDILAEALADRIMEHQCRGSRRHYMAWKQRASGGLPASGAVRNALLGCFVGPIFGLPDGSKTVPQDHLEGFVGQMIWFFLHVENPPENIVRIEPPGFRVTDAGGDGLAVHRMSRGHLMFRLWEVKKATGNSGSSSRVKSTVNEACKQLDKRALEYLGRYTSIGESLSNPELQDLYGQLPELWVDGSEQAAAGVAVTTSVRLVPTECFTDLGEKFPKFVNPVRLRGMLTAVGDFSAFCLKVREYVWKGI